jgi:hydroxymethylpyrimidine/phosphomethylpyrimidine kinase
MRLPVALTIAGSDSGGGAGIQADLKTFAALGVHGTSVITAITAQNTVTVTDIHEVPVRVIRAQIDTVVQDIGIQAVKTGMLASAPIIEAVAAAIKEHSLPNLVVDPVMVAKGGARLLHHDAIAALYRHLLPLATVITPNIPEAEVLLGRPIQSLADRRQAAKDLVLLGPQVAVVKGGHSETDAIDIFWDGHELVELPARRIPTDNTHGSGCAFSAAIAAGLAHGQRPLPAITNAKAFITSAIEHALDLGSGHGPVNPMFGSTSGGADWHTGTDEARTGRTF